MPDPLGESPALHIAEPTESVRLISVPTDAPEIAVGRRLPRWSIAVSFAAIVAAAVFMTTSRVLLPDSFLTLYAGRFIADHGIPTQDPFTVAAHGSSWIDQQWLAHWLYYTFWRAGGDAAVGALSGILIASAFGMLAMMIMRRGISPLYAVSWSCVAFFLCVPNTVIRAQSFAYPLYAGLLWIMLEDERRERFRWPILLSVPVILLWANLHGSALMGAAIAAIWAFYRSLVMRRRKDHKSSDRYLATAFCAGAAALAVSPYSPHALIDYYRSVLQNPSLAAYVPEWAPATFTGVSLFFVLLLGVVLVTCGIAIGRGKRPSGLPLVLSIVMAIAGIHAVRYQVWFAFPAAVLVADVVASIMPQRRGRIRMGVAKRTRTLGLVSVGMLLLGAGLSFASQGALALQLLCLFGGLVAGLMALSMGRPGSLGRIGQAIPVALVAAVLCASVAFATTSQSQFNTDLPAKALAAANAYAVAHPNVNVLGDDLTGPELLWRYPGLNGRVGYDSRYEILAQSKLLPFVHFVTLDSPSWAAVTRDYQEIVVSAPKNRELTARLRRLPGWHVIHSDADGLVIVRD